MKAGLFPILSKILLWMLILSGSGLIVWNTLPYFSLRTDLDFLLEKADLVNWVIWRAAFYFHISGGIICLLSAPAQFVGAWARRLGKIHRTLGKIYVFVVLLWAAPAGIFMSFFSKGGAQGHLVFLILGLVWWGLTWLAFRAIRNGNLALHIKMMLRSYAWALSALTFRIFQLILFGAGLADEPNYVVSLWLSLLTSFVTGELSVFLFKRGKLFSQFQPKSYETKENPSPVAV